MTEKFKLISKKIVALSLKEKEEIKRFLINCFKDNLEFKDVVYTNSNLEECLLLYSNNKLIGHIGINKRIINHKNKKYIIGGIGDVAIDQIYQKQGMGKKMMEKINGILKKENYDLGVLFCHPRLDHFYTYCGWVKKEKGLILATVNGVLQDQRRTFFLPINLSTKEIEIWNQNDINIGNGSW
jgi:predicted acetyltransferase